MRIIITANNASIDAPFSPRFGRCAYLIVADTESGEWEALPNPASSASGGAGPMVVQFISQQNVEAVITGRYGPNAFTALQAAGLRGFVAKGRTVRDVLEKFKAGEAEEVFAATGEELHGGGRHR
jgi:predicted Fe-Mo cluster-binding NifX family protein